MPFIIELLIGGFITLLIILFITEVCCWQIGEAEREIRYHEIDPEYDSDQDDRNSSAIRPYDSKKAALKL